MLDAGFPPTCKKCYKHFTISRTLCVVIRMVKRLLACGQRRPRILTHAARIHEMVLIDRTGEKSTAIGHCQPLAAATRP